MLDGIIPLAMLGEVQDDLAGMQQELEGLGTGFTVKGVVTKANLPASGELGDLYLVSDEGYASYVWDDVAEEYKLKDGDIASNAEIDSALY